MSTSSPDATPAATATITLDAKQQAQYDLITRDLQEVLGGDLIKALIAKGETVTCYWGTATTGKPHIAYFVALAKIADFLTAGVKVKILLAGSTAHLHRRFIPFLRTCNVPDIHAFLDNAKATYQDVAHRCAYYSKLLHAVFRSLGVPIDRLEFIVGSEYQLSRDYSMDNFRLSSIVTLRDATRAGSEVVKQVASPQLSSLLYPGMQALDEEYLGVDFQFGGVDQRKIFIMAEEFLPKLGYKRRAHLMNAMVPGLAGGKMSSSDPNSKIDFLDSAADVKKKIKAAFCEEKNVAENGLLSFMKAVIFPVQEMRRVQMTDRQESVDSAENRAILGIDESAPAGTVLSIARGEKYGGPIFFTGYQEMEDSFASGGLHPADLKAGTMDSINRLLEPIRKAFDEDESWKSVRDLAYPEPVAPAKPVKKTKEKKQQNGARTEEAASAEAFVEKSKAAAAEDVESVQPPVV